MNTASTRPTVILLILSYLAQHRGRKDDERKLLDALSPPSLPGDAQLDVRDSLRAAIDLKLVDKDGSEVGLSEGAADSVRKGERSAIALLRRAVLDESVNTGEWGSQSGARDLTNALAWYLCFSADTSPIQMDGTARSAKNLQTADFGPRQADGSGWPIGNDSRWQAFCYWVCGLGFAWVSPKGILVPDPTPAIREVLPAMFAKEQNLAARVFVHRIALALPVSDFGRYRQFVEENWRRREPDQRRLTAPLSEALERLRDEGLISFEDRADTPRLTRADGTTFSHVILGATP